MLRMVPASPTLLAVFALFAVVVRFALIAWLAGARIVLVVSMVRVARCIVRRIICCVVRRVARRDLCRVDRRTVRRDVRRVVGRVFCHVTRVARMVRVG